MTDQSRKRRHESLRIRNLLRESKQKLEPVHIAQLKALSDQLRAIELLAQQASVVLESQLKSIVETNSMLVDDTEIEIIIHLWSGYRLVVSPRILLPCCSVKRFEDIELDLYDYNDWPNRGPLGTFSHSWLFHDSYDHQCMSNFLDLVAVDRINVTLIGEFQRFSQVAFPPFSVETFNLCCQEWENWMRRCSALESNALGLWLTQQGLLNIDRRTYGKLSLIFGEQSPEYEESDNELFPTRPIRINLEGANEIRGPLPRFLMPEKAPSELYQVAAQTLFHGTCHDRPLLQASAAYVDCMVGYSFWIEVARQKN
tara:strand:+ start:1651 stop:2589 length:939 start_codon:yes stop_codon:yes gene_type:complete